MSKLDTIEECHALIAEYENLAAGVAIVAWYYCGGTFEKPEDELHRDALVGLSRAMDKLKEEAREAA